jgi:steroid delta-isomerase-like uncharacterized protein
MLRFFSVTSFVILLAACCPNSEAPLTTNKALVREFVTIGNARQFDRLPEVVADNFTRHSQATPGLVITNRDAFRAFMEQDALAFPDSQVTLHQVVAEGDRVAVWATYSGTQQGPMGGFPPSGKRMAVDFGAIFRIENGLIAELWVTWDNMAALAQLGLLPQPPEDNPMPD